MSLSPSTLFHFTSSLDDLTNILKGDFIPYYCREKLECVPAKYNGNTQNFNLAYPMVSFCDLPLSAIANHIKQYGGGYGIGLSKEWARRSGLNPVLYFDRQSLLLENWLEGFFSASKKKRGLANPAASVHMSILSYAKNYQGNLVRIDRRTGEKQSYPDYRFSDEREWRFVPKDSQLKAANLLGYIAGASYRTKREKAKHNRSIELSQLRLHFVPADVRYLIVQSEVDRPAMLDAIKRLYGTSLTQPQLLDLCSRILTFQEIRNDV